MTELKGVKLVRAEQQEVVYAFGHTMERTEDPFLVDGLGPQKLALELDEGALAFMLAHRDVLFYVRVPGADTEEAIAKAYDFSGMYFCRGWFLSEEQRQQLPSHLRGSIRTILTECGDHLRMVVLPRDKGYVIVSFREGDVLLEEMPAPDQFPAAYHVRYWTPES